MRLSNKRAVVTGASSGIGRAIAAAFAREGAAVVVNYANSHARATSVVEALRATGATAHAVQADVADAVAVEALVDEAWSLLGGIDIWANVAGADILTGANAEHPDLVKL
ncbi:MAG: SDR family NAD(P)-dependent oxidoreductase, partial [Gammaproteobacteria bacterium]